LTALSLECVFLDYSAEHTCYRCWDAVAHKIRTSRDIVFDESCPFYLRPSYDASPASLVDLLSFLLFLMLLCLFLAQLYLPLCLPLSLLLWFQITR
jgi:hypothetical protein